VATASGDKPPYTQGGYAAYSGDMPSTTLRIAAAVAVVATATTLSACGGPSTDRQPRPNANAAAQDDEAGKHDADDITFAHNMIAHHKQAIEMSQLAPMNTTNPDMVALAQQIITAQEPEIQAFTGFLIQWGEDPRGGANSGTGMAGMIDQTTMQRLGSLKGAEFDRLWLQSMINHDQGAITMAQAEIAHGQNSDVIYLARRTIDTQQAEIGRMKKMLAGPGG
jgi:uncharacterized protein (DUF305 family)